MSIYNPYAIDYPGFDPSANNNADKLNALNAAEGNSLAAYQPQTANTKLIGSLANPFGNAQSQFQSGPQFKFDDSHFSGPANDNGLRPLNNAGKAHVAQQIKQWVAPDNSNLITALRQSSTVGGQMPQEPGIMPLQKGLIGREFDSYITKKIQQ